MNRTQQREAARHAKAVADHERAEKRLVAAQNRWQKTRAALKRFEVKLDRQLLIGGSYDVREIINSPAICAQTCGAMGDSGFHSLLCPSLRGKL